MLYPQLHEMMSLVSEPSDKQANGSPPPPPNSHYMDISSSTKCPDMEQMEKGIDFKQP